MDMSKPDEDDLSRFPHCFLASNSPWDPSIVDEEFLYTDEMILLSHAYVNNETHMSMLLISLPEAW